RDSRRDLDLNSLEWRHRLGSNATRVHRGMQPIESDGSHRRYPSQDILLTWCKTLIILGRDRAPKPAGLTHRGARPGRGRVAQVGGGKMPHEAYIRQISMHESAGTGARGRELERIYRREGGRGTYDDFVKKKEYSQWFSDRAGRLENMASRRW